MNPEVLKRNLRHNQIIRKRMELQLQRINQKKRQQQQQIAQKNKQREAQLQSSSPLLLSETPLTEEQQRNLLNNPSFVSSLPVQQSNPINLQVRPQTLTINTIPKSLPIHSRSVPIVYPTPPNPKPLITSASVIPTKIENVENPEVEVVEGENVEKSDINEVVEETVVEEVVVEENPVYHIFPHNSAIPKTNNKKPTIQIFGAFNTGTNLMVNLFSHIFGIEIVREGSTRKWKHTLQIQNFPQCFHLLFIKNPFSWFQSMKKQPYNLNINNFNELLHHPVMMKKNLNLWLGDPFVKHFTSIAKVWLFYYQMYMNFASRNSNCFVVCFEDILYDNDNLLQVLSDIIKVPLPKNYGKIRDDVMKRPAKPHGNCNNLNKALKANDLNNLFKKYNKRDVERFFKDVPIHLILPQHQERWELHKWIERFNISTPPISPNATTDVNAPSIQP